jgi:hypothetical protein
MKINNIDLSTGEEMNYRVDGETNPVEIHVYNSEDIMKNRLDTCMKCEFVTTERMCSECNCPVVMMSQFNFKICPKGFWQ